ncbi:hypothetical protein ES705_14524 [subsurface metagenome]
MKTSTNESELKKLKAEVRQMKKFVECRSQIFGVNELCDLTGCTRAEVKKLVEEKKLPAHKFRNGRLYFSGNEIINFLIKN